ncbi:hypothetical protein WDW89_12145 [Deltaproteobacteria bacterium TL4]
MEAIELNDKDFQRLEHIAVLSGKSVQALMHEVIEQLESRIVNGHKQTAVVEEMKEWSDFSLSQAMRGMEDEPKSYTLGDIKTRY